MRATVFGETAADLDDNSGAEGAGCIACKSAGAQQQSTGAFTKTASYHGVWTAADSIRAGDPKMELINWVLGVIADMAGALLLLADALEQVAGAGFGQQAAGAVSLLYTAVRQDAVAFTSRAAAFCVSAGVH